MLICLSLSATFQPFAARTQQYVKEQLGAADEKTQLPDDYIELEKRVDALKQVHQKLLSVTYVLDAPRLSYLAATYTVFSARNTPMKPMTTRPTSGNPSTTSAGPLVKRSSCCPTRLRLPRRRLR